MPPALPNLNAPPGMPQLPSLDMSTTSSKINLPSLDSKPMTMQAAMKGAMAKPPLGKPANAGAIRRQTTTYDTLQE